MPMAFRMLLMKLNLGHYYEMRLPLHFHLIHVALPPASNGLPTKLCVVYLFECKRIATQFMASRMYSLFRVRAGARLHGSERGEEMPGVSLTVPTT